jgi:hypothetical protein
MTAARRGLDAIKTRSLRQRSADAAEAVRVHVTGCPRCRKDEFWPRHCCDDGYNLLREAKRAANFLTVYLGNSQEGNSNEQGTLW